MVRQVRYGEGREALLSATVFVVAEKGLRGLTFRAVGERAGVNNTLVAHHFGTRNTLLSAALSWAVEQSIEATGLLHLSSVEDFERDLLALLTTRPELQAFQYEMILEARRNPIFAEPVRELYGRYHDVVVDSLRGFGIPGDLNGVARHAFATMDGLVLQYMAGLDAESVRVGLEDLWTYLLERR